jgi:hypothetical protein
MLLEQHVECITTYPGKLPVQMIPALSWNPIQWFEQATWQNEINMHLMDGTFRLSDENKHTTRNVRWCYTATPGIFKQTARHKPRTRRLDLSNSQLPFWMPPWKTGHKGQVSGALFVRPSAKRCTEDLINMSTTENAWTGTAYLWSKLTQAW